jgi:hypothetical protein
MELGQATGVRGSAWRSVRDPGQFVDGRDKFSGMWPSSYGMRDILVTAPLDPLRVI